ASYCDAQGHQLMEDSTIDFLSAVSDYMAIKQDGKKLSILEMVQPITFDESGQVTILDDSVTITRNGSQGFIIRQKRRKEVVNLQVNKQIVPFSGLPVPSIPQRPVSFGIKHLGTRNGFDLTGPSTGFVIWLNGRAVIYDGPVGTRYLLEHQGISCEDIDIVILSHCHEDHMGAFIELVLSGHRPKVFTTEPIYRSALIKLSTYFNMSPEEVSQYLNYHRVTPGVPIEALGATFDFFYSVHAIPTIGMNITFRDETRTVHQFSISGDSLHREGLDHLRNNGLISDEIYRHMRYLVPNKKIDNSLFYCDVGESIIHGHPKDWAENPNEVVYYHCADNSFTRSFGKEIAVPGYTRSIVEPRKMHPSIPTKVLHALRFLDIKDPAWLSTILFRGQTRHAAPGERLAKAGQRAPNTITVIVSGSASIRLKNNTSRNPLPLIRPGEFFGLFELVTDGGYSRATITAITPMELFDIDSELFQQYLEQYDLSSKIKMISKNRVLLDQSEVFATLDLSIRNKIAQSARAKTLPKNHRIGSLSPEKKNFYVLIRGTIDLVSSETTIGSLSESDQFNYIGLENIFTSAEQAPLSAITTSECKVLEFDGSFIKELAEQDMSVRFHMHSCQKQRQDMAQEIQNPT
ncbi:MAG: cyclic nucleotide-binding domain-containing protein, partial [Myxococcota bacterium]|nr:cyclic nucleotide-binding domain-containing protein [Myxococcota bacterium]